MGFLHVGIQMFQDENDGWNSILFEVCGCVVPRMNFLYYGMMLADDYGKYIRFHSFLVIKFRRVFSVK